MINFKYDLNSKLVYITFGGENFQEILLKVKSLGFCKYNPDRKIWISQPEEIYSYISSFREIEPIKIENEDSLRQYIRDSFNRKKTTEFIRRKLEISNIVYPPIEGKSPNENFQLECIKKGIQQNRLALFLGMGSGKTYIVTTILNQLYKDNEVDKIVVVAPSEGIYNWRRELLKFSNFLTKDEIVICKADKNRNPFDLNLEKIKVLIMTYRHYLTISDDFYKKKYKKSSKNYRNAVIPWGEFGEKRAIILDESHNIKSYKSRQSKVLRLHKNYFDYRYLLTGTPTPNSFIEIYTQIEFLDDSYINKSYYGWLGEIANVGNRFSQYAVNYVYKDKQEEYEKKFNPLVIRYTSDELLELPELYIKNIYAELTDMQKQIYEMLINYQIAIIKEEHGRLVPRELRNKFAYISLAYENAEMLKNKIDPVRSNQLAKLVNKFNLEKHHGKIEILDSLLDEYINDENKKVTVFDFHPATLNRLAERYKKYNPVVIHGQIEGDNEERENRLNKFKNDKNCNLLIGSFRVLSTAINITECKRVIYFSRDFSYTNWSQSIKRFHRIGQTDSVIINPLIFEDSLDLYIEETILRKNKLDKELFKKESLSKEQWQSIFKGSIV
jgi:SNF2 family DNA or RNA helicase